MLLRMCRRSLSLLEGFKLGGRRLRLRDFGDARTDACGLEHLEPIALEATAYPKDGWHHPRSGRFGMRTLRSGVQQIIEALQLGIVRWMDELEAARVGLLVLHTKPDQFRVVGVRHAPSLVHILEARKL
jgi:hypothetical protein